MGGRVSHEFRTYFLRSAAGREYDFGGRLAWRGARGRDARLQRERGARRHARHQRRRARMRGRLRSDRRPGRCHRHDGERDRRRVRRAGRACARVRIDDHCHRLPVDRRSKRCSRNRRYIEGGPRCGRSGIRCERGLPQGRCGRPNGLCDNRRRCSGSQHRGELRGIRRLGQ